MTPTLANSSSSLSIPSIASIKSPNARLRLLATLLLPLILCAAASAGTFCTDNPRCEGVADPLGIEMLHPVLSWNDAGGERGARQTAYQILVASNRDIRNEAKADLWNSGKVTSSAQRATYSGQPLHAAQRAFWTVRIWDDKDRPSDWCAPAQWAMGLLAPSDWTAKWIAGAEDAPAPLPIFRKEIDVAKPVARATAFVCGLGHFDLYLNGAKAGDHFCDPGWTNYKATCLYVPFDVTGQLRQGRNALGVMLGNGMYNVTGGRYTKFTGSFGGPKLVLQLHIEYQDGSSDRIVTDASWRTAPGPITFSCVYGGEDYDARLEQPGWDSPNFDDTKWKPAREVAGPGGVLRVSDAPPVTVAETRTPAKVDVLQPDAKAPGELRYDMGLNLSARPAIKLRGPAGSAVTVRVGELADRPWDGHSYTYTLRGGGDEWFRPHFTYFGFQYIFVQGAARADERDAPERPRIVDVNSEFVTSSAPRVGAFHCGNELFNEIDEMIDHSVRSNLQSVVTDCPHREKLGWLEVPHLMGPSILYHYDVRGLYRKICRDTTEAQLDSGLVPDIAPEYTRFQAGFFESAEWGSACVQVPWLLYRWYGDTDILSRQFDTMAKYTRYLASTRNDKGLAKGGLGDWYDWTPEKGHAGNAQLTPNELTATAMLFDNARILAETARILGKKDDAESFATLAARVHDDFIKAYYDPAAHSVATGSQSALAVGLHFGLVPEADRGAVLDNLVHAVESMNYRPTTGEVCFRFMVRALADAGRSDVVYRIINRTDPPGYGCMLRQFGLKTLSEQWDKPGSSLNHCMFGHIQEWFQGDVLGIRQADGSVGFERLRIAPAPAGDLLEASGYYDSPRGKIAVAWKKTGGAFHLDLTVPGNTSAEVLLPVSEKSVVTEGGQPANESRGIRERARTNAGILLEVGAGEYAFETIPAEGGSK